MKIPLLCPPEKKSNVFLQFPFLEICEIARLTSRRARKSGSEYRSSEKPYQRRSIDGDEITAARLATIIGESLLHVHSLAACCAEVTGMEVTAYRHYSDHFIQFISGALFVSWRAARGVSFDFLRSAGSGFIRWFLLCIA